jgi:hypothetical protein
MTNTERQQHLENELAAVDRKIHELQNRLLNLYDARGRITEEQQKMVMQQIQAAAHDKEID